MRRVGDEAIVEAARVDMVDDGAPASLLSKREFEVYELLCAGLSDRQIAECLFISEETVKAHAHHIFDKLGIRSGKRSPLMRRAGAPIRRAKRPEKVALLPSRQQCSADRLRARELSERSLTVRGGSPQSL